MIAASFSPDPGIGQLCRLGSYHLPKNDSQHFRTLEITGEHRCLQSLNQHRIFNPCQRADRCIAECGILGFDRLLKK